MHAVFISYSSEDKTVAFGACHSLEAGGVSCWIAPRDVMAGRPYSGQITEAIRRARVFVLILSRNSDQSRQVLREVERAAHSKIHLLTLRTENFEPSDDLAYFLSVEHWLNAYAEGSPEPHFEELLQHAGAMVREDISEWQGALTKTRADAAPTRTEKFANYDIVKHPDGTLFRLGPGAMGVTYKAFDTSLDRYVALKVIGADLLGSDEARRRFLREARAAAKIQHPHVAAIYHLGQEGKDYFYTMELVEGVDMQRYVDAHGPLPPAMALRVTRQVAEALEAAQAHKLIHRDIKPANIMARVNRAGKLDVKLIDFGLAKGAATGSPDASLLTNTVTFVGSPAYASPEQCEMGDLDTRSDIYSLGATLWYLLTGKSLFVGNVNRVLIAHVTKPPPFAELREIPEPVVELLRRMLAKRPEDRPQDPQALQEAIEAAEKQLAPDSISSAPESFWDAGTSGAAEGLMTTPQSPFLDAYQRLEIGALAGERYRLVDEQTEGNGGRLFLASDEKPAEKSTARVAIKLVHPDIASNPGLLDLVCEEIKVVKSVAHPNLLRYFELERNAPGPFIVREWVHGFLLYDLLRLRRSCRPREVIAVLEPLVATLDFISEQGFGLVEVSIRKLFLCCPEEVHPNQFESIAKGDAKDWTECALKLNPLSLAPILFRERRDWSSQTLVPSSRILSMTQAETGIQGSKAVELLARLVYELISGRAPSVRVNERLSPLSLLNEAGNQTLRKACASTGEVASFRNCEEFWRIFKETASNSVRPTSAVPPQLSKPLVVQTPKEVDPKLAIPGKPQVKKPARLVIGLVLVILVLIYFGIRLPPVFMHNPAQPSASPSAVATPTLVPVPSPIQKGADLGNATSMFGLGVKYRDGQGVTQDYDKARELFQKAADAGNADAMMNMGFLYEKGHGVAQDYGRAREWYQKGADAGSATSMFDLGVLYRDGLGVAQDYDKARELFQKAAAAGNTDAMTTLGWLYEKGHGVAQDYGKAREWYQKAADAGNAFGMNGLGWQYQNGLGVAQDYEKAGEQYQKAADAGNVFAMMNLGFLYEKGYGVTQDYGKAREWYQKGADAGNATSMFDLGVLYRDGLGVAQDYDKARELFQKGADAGNSDAMMNLGFLYDKGMGVAQDYGKAREWYQKGADAGNATSMFDLGVLYRDGQGVAQDYDKARELFQKSADAGDTDAMTTLGWLYEKGLGVAQDYGKAREWYQKGADAGNVFAMNDLGWLYQNGQGVAQDYGKAREWYQKGADAGNAIAMNNLGWLYDKGLGAAQDYGKAHQWYQKGADAGNAIAMNNLGELYYSGHGVAQDYGKAREWYQKAADAGNTDGLFNLGWLYEHGQGVAQDYGKAREWYQKGADAGNTDAKAAVSRLRLHPEPNR